jgi:hypothetical protein
MRRKTRASTLLLWLELAGTALVLGCRSQPAPEAASASARAESQTSAPKASSLPEASTEAAPKLLAPQAADSLPTAAPSNTTPEAAERTSAAKPGARRVYRVAALGDSLTDRRVGGGKYLDVLKERCPKSRFHSYGVGGEMVNQMRRRFQRDVLDGRTGGEKYTDVIIYGGVNDLYSDLTAGRNNPKIQGDLQAMYALAQAACLRVVALTVSPWGGFKRY